MSFVFEQLDALQCDRKEKDDALQRIRAWRHSKQQQFPPPPDSPAVVPVESKELEDSWGNVLRKEIEFVHPWPEWIELLERLLQQNYLDPGKLLGKEEDEEERTECDREGKEKIRDWNAVVVAAENFGKDRFDILKSLSRKDIEVLVGHGCPSAQWKVAYSAKLLRKHAHVDEGDVCSACSLRSNCSRGFLVLPKELEARTVDVMRVLLTFAFDSINGSVQNESLMKMKSVKTVVRKLLHEIVKLSAVPIDPNIPQPVPRKVPPKVKQPPPPPKRRVGRDDVEMKKGDWLCAKCDFMNFAKNVVCLQCDAKRPKRQLLPGEWECPQCNFLNYRRNMTCFHCECKRPPDEYMENQENTRRHCPQTTHSKDMKIQDVSHAWNLDFDDHESDGADVAAFEFADSLRVGQGSMQGGASDCIRGFADDFVKHEGKGRVHENGHFASSNKNQMHGPKIGFDDFDDEEDDVDNYEIMSMEEHVDQIPHRNVSEFDIASESEDLDSRDGELKTNRNSQKLFSDSENSFQNSDSEVDQSDLSQWKPNKQERSFPSNNVQELDSDYDDMDQNFSQNQKEHSRQRLNKSDVRFSNRDIKPNRLMSPVDDTRNFRRPLRGEGFEYDRDQSKVTTRNELRGSVQRFQHGKSKNIIRPSRGERLGYNQHRNSKGIGDRSRIFDDRPHRNSKDIVDRSRIFDDKPHRKSKDIGGRSRIFDDRPHRRIIER